MHKARLRESLYLRILLSVLGIVTIVVVPVVVIIGKENPREPRLRGQIAMRQRKRSAADVGGDDVAEPLPAFALEAHQLQL